MQPWVSDLYSGVILKVSVANKCGFLRTTVFRLIDRPWTTEHEDRLSNPTGKTFPLEIRDLSHLN
jgi:hypothetical protein